MPSILLFIIRIYQTNLSLDHGWLGRIVPMRICRFYPSCSEYAYQAINQKGVLMGVWLAISRIAKCHPWHPGGVDQVV